jgi:[protein-PII] uridylyltransferase
VTERVPDLEALNLLRALTESDARATAPKAWSTWRANLIDTVGRQAAEALGGAQVAALAKPTWAEVAVPKAVRKGATCIDLELLDDGAQVTVIAPDRLGLLADVAALFATQRASVRAARAWSQGDVAVSVWDIADAHLDGAVLRQRFDAIAAGRLDPAARLRRTLGEGLAPTVVVRPEASSQSTVLEVRAADRTGVLYLACAALAAQGLTVRSAHVDTLGPQAVDVFYVQEEGAGALGDLRASQAAHAVREALTPTS